MACSSRARALHLCRLCHGHKEYRNCSGVFNDKNQSLSHRISDLEESIEEGDGLPTMICRSCVGKFLTIESKLESLKALAQSSYEAYVRSNISCNSECTRKHVGVSPITSHVQPLAKQFQRSTCRKLRLGQCRKLINTLAGGHKAIFAHDSIRKELLLKAMDLVNAEVDALCRKEKV